MAVEMNGVYTGGLHCELKHGPSGSVIFTDAPKDNNGKGEAFSPTDLVGAALGSCILTTMAMVAERDGHSITGAAFKVEKEMNPNPRKIAKLSLHIRLPAAIPEAYRAKLEHFSHTCPVSRSLSPEVQVPVVFDWSL